MGPGEKRLHIADYLIFAATVIISLGIGIYHALVRRKQRTASEYFLGNRRLQTLPVALSILVSFVSAILVLGTPAEMYTQGTQMTMRTIGYSIAIWLAAMFLVPLFYGLKLTSSFEYLEQRYGSRTVKLLGTFMMIMGNLLYMGLVIYTPSTALEAVSGIPFWVSVLASALVATVYTAIGGMRAVVWTDVFQAVVMVSGMIAIVVQGTLKVGGISKVWELSSRGGRLIFFDFNVDPTQRLSFWSLVIGGMFSSLGIFGIGQPSMQRYCALPTLARAKRSLYLNIPGIIVVNILASLVGLVIYAYYAQVGCDPLKQKYISNSNQLVPYFVLDVLNYPGFPGIFLAVLFSGALSSMSSVLNSLAAVTWQDILSHWCISLKESHKAVVNKITVLFYGSVSIMLGFLTQQLGVNVLQASLTFTGVSMGPSLGLFLAGALFPFVNTSGALIGCATSLVLSLWIVAGNFVHRQRAPRLPTINSGCPATNHTLWNVTSSGLIADNAVLNTTAHSASLSRDEGNYSVLATTAVPDLRPGVEGVNALYGLSFLWYTAIGACVTITVAAGASFIINKIRGGVPRKVDPSLVINFREALSHCVPCRWRQCLVAAKDEDSEEEVSTTQTYLAEGQKDTPGIKLKGLPSGYKPMTLGNGHIETITDNSQQQRQKNEPDKEVTGLPNGYLHKTQENGQTGPISDGSQSQRQRDEPNCADI